MSSPLSLPLSSPLSSALPSTPSPRTTLSSPPPIRVSRVTTDYIRSESGSESRPRRNEIFSPIPMHMPMHMPVQIPMSSSTRYPTPEEEIINPLRVTVVPSFQILSLLRSSHHQSSVSSVFTPDNPEYWRVNWRSFLNNPYAFKDAIKISPLEYQEDINKVLDTIYNISRSTTNSHPARL